MRSGSDFGSWPLEKEACAKLGLDLHKVLIRGREAPRKSDLLDLIDLLASLNYPALIHCKSGADRTGFVAAVYLIAIEGRPIDEGLAQLSLRFGHLRSSRAGILHEVIEAFRREGAAYGFDFRQWVENAYDAAAVSEPLPTAALFVGARRLRAQTRGVGGAGAGFDCFGANMLVSFLMRVDRR